MGFLGATGRCYTWTPKFGLVAKPFFFFFKTLLMKLLKAVTQKP